MNFPEFDGNERSGEDNGEEFRPPPAKGKTHSFGESEPGIEKRAGAENFQVGVVEHRDTVEEMANKDIAGIDANEIGPSGKVRGDILVDQIERADGDRKEKHGL